ncbi:hypothetical protein D3C87_1205750 [compost metagenome]
MAGRDGFDRAVHRIELVVPRAFVRRVVESSDTAFFRRPTLPGAVAAPQFLRRRKLVEGEVLLQHASGQRGVPEDEAIAIAGEAERYVQQLCVVQRLSHA